MYTSAAVPSVGFGVEAAAESRHAAVVSTEGAGSDGVRGCRKVLVVDLGFLGDTIHTLPALRELRRHHAQAGLHVVTTPVGAEVLRLVDCVDRVWTVPLGSPSPPWWRHLDLQWRLFRERFDCAINFSGADRTLFMTAFAGVRRRVTRAGRRGGWWRRALAGELIAAPSRSLPVYEQRRRVLAGAGYGLEPARFDLRIPAAEGGWAAAVLEGFGGTDRDVVHVSINASSPFKEWPVECWVDWVKRFLAEGRGVVLATGSPKEREQARLRQLSAGVGDARLKVISEGLSIPRLAALVARCRLHVGTDSGVTHLAMALGLATVSVFRDYAGLEEWRPVGPGHTAVTSPCACVDRPAMQPECLTTGTAMCLARIAPEAVMAGVDRVWGAVRRGD